VHRDADDDQGDARQLARVGTWPNTIRPMTVPAAGSSASETAFRAAASGGGIGEGEPEPERLPEALRVPGTRVQALNGLVPKFRLDGPRAPVK